MSFIYPSHCKFPEGESNFFANHFDMWNQLVSQIKGNKNGNWGITAIEIGVLYGGCSVWLLETLLTNPQDTLHCIDINESEYLKNNLSPYKNVKFHLGASADVLTELWHEHKAPIADLIYVDGSHFAKHVLEDAVLSWRLLKPHGVMVFDDYAWNLAGHPEDQPKTGINAFLNGYQTHYDILGMGWQVYIQKREYNVTSDTLGVNYAANNPHFNKEKY